MLKKHRSKSKNRKNSEGWGAPWATPSLYNSIGYLLHGRLPTNLFEGWGNSWATPLTALTTQPYYAGVSKGYLHRLNKYSAGFPVASLSNSITWEMFLMALA